MNISRRYKMQIFWMCELLLINIAWADKLRGKFKFMFVIKFNYFIFKILNVSYLQPI